MDAALLSGTDADGLSVLHIAHAVALGVLEDDEGDDEISLGLITEVLVFCWDIREERIIVKLDVIAPLLEGNAENLSPCDGCGNVIWIYLDDIISAFALLF